MPHGCWGLGRYIINMPRYSNNTKMCLNHVLMCKSQSVIKWHFRLSCKSEDPLMSNKECIDVEVRPFIMSHGCWELGRDKTMM